MSVEKTNNLINRPSEDNKLLKVEEELNETVIKIKEKVGGENKIWPLIGGVRFGDAFLLIGEEYKKMIEQNKLNNEDTNELCGIEKYLQEANRLLNEAKNEEMDNKNKRPKRYPFGSHSVYYEPLDETINGVYRIILVNTVEKFNKQCEPQDKFFINFSHPNTMGRYEILNEMAIFVKHSKKYLEKAGSNSHEIEKAITILEHGHIYGGIDLNKKEERGEDGLVGTFKSAPRDNPSLLIDWLPLWLRKQPLFTQNFPTADEKP